MEYLVGKVLEGRYKFVGVLGKGGMSIVYKVLDIKLEKYWAIKQVERKSEKLDKQLEKEAQILKKVDHSALPRIVDVFEDSKNILIVMDYIDGVSLDRKLRSDKFINEKELIRYSKQLCDALAYLHNQKPNPIIYRDMKPGNIMVSPSGKIKLIDFGIAREYTANKARDTVILGTESYAAPEQIGNYRTDQRTDIYSLGATIYHLATGKSKLDPPYGFVKPRLVNASISEGLEKIILKCVQDNPKDRYQRVEEILYDFENIHRLNEGFNREKKARMRKLILPTVATILSASILFTGLYKLNEEINYKYNGHINNIEAAILRNDITKAEEETVEAIATDKKNEEVYILMGNAYLKQGMYEECIDLLEDNLIITGSKLAESDNIRYLLGLAYFEYKNYSAAYENFQLVDVEKIPLVKFYSELAYAFDNINEKGSTTNLMNSIEEYEKIISEEKDRTIRIDGYLKIADIYMENPDIFKNSEAKSITLLEKVEKESTDISNPLIYEKLGQAYTAKALKNILDPEIKAEFLEKANIAYLRVIELGYRTPNIYLNLASIYKYQEEFTKCEKILKDMINLYPNNHRGYTQIALLYNDLELRKPRAERDFADVFKYYELATNYINKNNDTQEYQTLKKVVDEIE